MRRPTIWSAVLCSLLAACGGGSGGSALPAAPVTGTGGAPASPVSASGLQNVTLSIIVPAPTAAASSRRRPRYVSTHTQSISVAIDGAAPVIANLSATSPNCAGTPQGVTCSLSIGATVGTHLLAETLYAGLNATGSPLASGTTSATISAGVTNVVKLSLSGIASAIQLAVSPATLSLGTPASVGLTVTVLDAGGAAIVGSDVYFNSIALNDSDTSGATTLSKTTLVSPGDLAGLTLTYSGAPLTQATVSASAPGIPAANVTPVTLTVAPKPSTLTDYSTYGYDNARDGFNPNSQAFTPGSAGQIHVAWQSTVDQSVQLSGSQTMPIVATNVGGHAGIVIVGGVNGDFYGFDALSGTRLWKTPSLGDEAYTCAYGSGTQFHVGVGGTPLYDPGSKSFYVTANANSGPNTAAQNTLYHFDALTGRQLGSVPLTSNLQPNELDFAHTSVTLGPNGLLYAGIGSTCDVPNTRGQVVAVNPATMSVAARLFTAWNQGGNYAGGGVWGWGGVSIDSSGNVYTAAGNTWDARNAPETLPPFSVAPSEQSAYGEHMLKLDGNLNILDSNVPKFAINPPADDLDFTGTPMLFEPMGCDVMAAGQGKAGQLFLYDTQRIGSGTLAQYQLSQPYYFAAYLGNPTYSPATGLVYANVASSRGGSVRPPGLIAIQPVGCSGFQVLWNAQFGPDSFAYQEPTTRGVPTVTAGGVVFASSPCTPDGSGNCGAAGGTAAGAMWAIDASSGQLLNNGKPILVTPGQIRMSPVVDGNWLYVYDNDGDLYALTVDATIKAATLRRTTFSARSMNVPHG